MHPVERAHGLNAGYAAFGTMTAGDEAPPSDVAPPAMSPSTAQRIMSEPEFGDDALSAAPPTTDNNDGFKPTRRVRAAPGGTSSMGSIFSDGQEAFIPTRKVRERPGGADNIEGLF